MRNLNKLYEESGEEKNRLVLNPYPKPHWMWWHPRTAIFPNALLATSPTLHTFPFSLNQQKDAASKSKDGNSTAM